MLLLNAPLKKFSYKLLFYLCERLTSTHLFFVMVASTPKILFAVLYLACKENKVRFGGGEGWWQLQDEDEDGGRGWVALFMCVYVCVCMIGTITLMPGSSGVEKGRHLYSLLISHLPN